MLMMMYDDVRITTATTITTITTGFYSAHHHLSAFSVVRRSLSSLSSLSLSLVSLSLCPATILRGAPDDAARQSDVMLAIEVQTLESFIDVVSGLGGLLITISALVVVFMGRLEMWTDRDYRAHKMKRARQRSVAFQRKAHAYGLTCCYRKGGDDDDGDGDGGEGGADDASGADDDGAEWSGAPHDDDASGAADPAAAAPTSTAELRALNERIDELYLSMGAAPPPAAVPVYDLRPPLAPDQHGLDDDDKEDHPAALVSQRTGTTPDTVHL
jgi:hypothetical protein